MGADVATNRTVEAEFIDRRGEDFTLSQDFRGNIACRGLVIMPGVTLRGSVVAANVDVQGVLIGNMSGSRGVPSALRVAPGGRVEGEVHSLSIKVEGRANAILHGREVEATSGSEVLGYVVCDILRTLPGCSMNAAVFQGEGKSQSTEALDPARRMRALSLASTKPIRQNPPSVPLAVVPPVRNASVPSAPVVSTIDESGITLSEDDISLDPSEISEVQEFQGSALLETEVTGLPMEVPPLAHEPVQAVSEPSVQPVVEPVVAPPVAVTVPLPVSPTPSIPQVHPESRRHPDEKYVAVVPSLLRRRQAG